MDGHETKKRVQTANNEWSFEHKLDFLPGPSTFSRKALNFDRPKFFFVPSSAVHFHPDDRSVWLTINQTFVFQVKFY